MIKAGEEAWLKVSRNLNTSAKMQVREAVKLVPVGCEFASLNYEGGLAQNEKNYGSLLSVIFSNKFIR